MKSRNNPRVNPWLLFLGFGILSVLVLRIVKKLQERATIAKLAKDSNQITLPSGQLLPSSSDIQAALAALKRWSGYSVWQFGDDEEATVAFLRKWRNDFQLQGLRALDAAAPASDWTEGRTLRTYYNDEFSSGSADIINRLF